LGRGSHRRNNRRGARTRISYTSGVALAGGRPSSSLPPPLLVFHGDGNSEGMPVFANPDLGSFAVPVSTVPAALSLTFRAGRVHDAS
jgi:hypothetical protein